jgi:hypothetical protein
VAGRWVQMFLGKAEVHQVHSVFVLGRVCSHNEIRL